MFNRGQVLCLLLGSALWGCGGEPSGVLNFAAPGDILISATPYQLAGAVHRLALVANPESGTVTVLNADDESVLDLDGFDSRKSPIAVGGTPVSLALQAVADGTVTDRIFVADQGNNRIVALELLQNAPGDDERVRYRYADAGGAQVSGGSKPTFEDTGALSTPRAGAVTVDPAKVINQNWRVEWDSDNYVVKGSVSGQQAKRLAEDQPYTNDDGSFSLTINRGTDPTNGGDNWIFGTYVFKPLELSFPPASVMVHGGDLVAVSRDTGVLAIYQIDGYAWRKTVPLADGTGDTPVVRAAYLFGDRVLVLNQIHPTAIVYDLNADTQTVINLAAGSVSAFANPDNTVFYLLLEKPDRLVAYDAGAGALLTSSIDFPSTPRAGAAADFGTGSNQGAVATQEHGVYLVDLARFVRIDLNGGGGTRSQATGPRFQDIGASSNPHMTSVTTKDGATRTEVWTVVYEGVVPGAVGSSGQLNGTSFSDVSQQFQTRRVQAGDLLVVEQPQPLELPIASVDSESGLTLASDSGLNLNGVVYTVRAAKSLVVAGSISGTQVARAKTEATYVSDQSQVGFSIFDDIGSPITRGDLFTFRTFDGVQAVSVSGGDPSRAIAAAANDGSRNLLWVTFAGNSTVGIIDLKDKNQKKLIN